MAIKNIFSIPIYKYSLETSKINPAIEKYLKGIKYKDFKSPWFDNLLTTIYRQGTVLSDIEPLQYEVYQHCNLFLKGLNLSPKRLKLEDSWFNFYEKDHFQYAHSHVGTLTSEPCLSGVYFHSTNGKDGDLVFNNVNNQYINSPLHEPFYPISPKEGDLIIFPSYLVHHVNPNLTEHLRISISFNITCD